jgi:hypothetical protein
MTSHKDRVVVARTSGLLFSTNARGAGVIADAVTKAITARSVVWNTQA